MKVAIIHYWLVGMRGGERVLERIIDLYPNADIFTHVYDPKSVSEKIRSRKVFTTFINRLPRARSMYQSYLPLMPMALESLDLNGYDLVISSEAGPAKGIIPPPEATHVCYCHSPMRYIWDQYHVYRDNAGFVTKIIMPVISHIMRQWDVTSATRVDQFVSNSSFVGKRIKKYYRRNSEIIYPPVAVEEFSQHITSDISDEYIWIGQLVPYKRADIVVEAFNRLGLPLMIVGRGGDRKRLQKIAKSNIRFVDSLPFNELKNLCGRTKALVFTAKEDFGITPVEVMAAGRPVIAFGQGGAAEIVVDGVTGLFFDEQTADSLIAAVEAFQEWVPSFKPADAQAQAWKFHPHVFDAQFSSLVARAMSGNEK